MRENTKVAFPFYSCEEMRLDWQKNGFFGRKNFV